MVRSPTRPCGLAAPGDEPVRPPGVEREHRGGLVRADHLDQQAAASRVRGGVDRLSGGPVGGGPVGGGSVGCFGGVPGRGPGAARVAAGQRGGVDHDGGDGVRKVLGRHSAARRDADAERAAPPPRHVGQRGEGGGPVGAEVEHAEPARAGDRDDQVRHRAPERGDPDDLHPGPGRAARPDPMRPPPRPPGRRRRRPRRSRPRSCPPSSAAPRRPARTADLLPARLEAGPAPAGAAWPDLCASAGWGPRRCATLRSVTGRPPGDTPGNPRSRVFQRFLELRLTVETPKWSVPRGVPRVSGLP